MDAARTELRHDSIESPTLRALVCQARDDQDAVDEFWAKLERTGPPLVEPLADNFTERLVTFLWRDDGTSQGVAVIARYSVIDIEPGRMDRLAGANLWYRSYRNATSSAGRVMCRFQQTAAGAAPQPGLFPDGCHPRFR